ncbi:hypothetical protein Bsp3421_003651 [Burkholderia sp. FERM BP-3421]|uniref:hypothetical protein n=1 Tax=Burkholderia sp. FERM BP-3421 TaxID=1494466 RepID=UPI002360DB4B|nr:hypothetical protein [Burkholderia sp. FERM BP-3421]WDD93563.1 hypothetical protein Bsp3421_003651 [Burkholderia sp. FERM BP-3421]
MKALSQLIEAIGVEPADFATPPTLPVALPRRARITSVLSWVGAYLVDHPDDTLGLYLYRARADLPCIVTPVTQASLVRALDSSALEPILGPDVLEIVRADVLRAFDLRRRDDMPGAGEHDAASAIESARPGFGGAGLGSLPGQSRYRLREYRCPACGHTVSAIPLDGLPPPNCMRNHPPRHMEPVAQ